MLSPDEAPVLVETSVDEAPYVDIVTERGCVAAGLPRTYPLDAAGREIGRRRCQPIGQAAWQAGEPGIACRSAARSDGTGEERALFRREGQRPLRMEGRRILTEWF